MNEDQNSLFMKTTPLEELGEIEDVSLAGFQVTRAELFSHLREPSISVSGDRIKFNMACLKRFPGVTHIQILIHPEEKRLIIRPCNPDAPDSLRWCSGGGEKDIKNRDMICRIFAAKLYELMDWNPEYKYKMLGKPAVAGDEMLFLFRLTDFEFFVNDGKSKRRRAYLPDEWRSFFGVGIEKHDEQYNIDLADGYVKM